MMKRMLFLAGMVVLVSCGQYKRNQARSLEEFCTMLEKKISHVDDIYRFFPKSVEEIKDYSACAILRAQRDLDKLQAIPASERTFDNTARALDKIGGTFSNIHQTLGALEMVSPDAAFRDAAHQESLKMSAFSVDAFSNKKLYNAFKEYVEGNAKKETLNAEQRYFLDESMKDFKRAGLMLPDDQLDEVKALKKELSELGQKFDRNVAEDKSKIAIREQDLAGCNQNLIDSLKRDEQGNVVVGCDYPTVFEVLGHCSVGETRKKLFKAFNNRAYPANVDILKALIAKRDALARKLGFESYAALDIDSEMAKTPARAERFILDLAARANVKAQQEIDLFKKELPEGIALDAQGRFYPWDLGYVKEIYKKKHFDVDDRAIAEYFVAEPTLNGVFDIYQKFLSLEFAFIKPAWAWHDDVKLLEVRERDTKALRGYVFLDLHPRDNKYSHACHCGLVQSIKVTRPDGTVEKTPSVALVIANFPQGNGTHPALLKHQQDVETFFHEFGHAMHFLLGSTELISFAGTAVKTDFVEMPSQIFEEWMFDKSLLRGLSKHYKTGASLPDEMIDKIIALKKFDSGLFITRQCFFSMLSLDLYKAGEHKDLDALSQSLAQKMVPQVAVDLEAHMYASFGHLVGYGAKYYGYMWSKVFALDLFYALKDQGLVNPATGAVFINKILGKGGSEDPNNLLKDYLGREPQQDAFFQDLGITT